MNKLPSITENPSSSLNNNQNKAIICLTDVNSSTMLKSRKITTTNAHAAKLRILNNIRMQRACRFSMKKVAINTIIKNSNSQRLFNNDGTNTTQIVGLPEIGNQNETSSGQKRINRNREKSSKTNGAIAGVKTSTTASTKKIQNPMFNSSGLPGAGNSGNSSIDFKLFQYNFLPFCCYGYCLFYFPSRA